MNLVERVKNILITPKTEWDKIAAEETALPAVLTTYVLPLSLIGAVATLLGWGLIGKSIDLGFLGSIPIKGWDIGIKYAIVSVVSVIVGYFVTAFVVDALAPSFGSEKNLNRSAQLVGYGYTPALIGAALGILPSIAWLGALFGLYGLYLMYLGLGPLKKTPEDKKVIYLVITIVVMIVVYVVVGLILAAVFGLNNIGKLSLT
mgnify:CR=1 FL=1